MTNAAPFAELCPGCFNGKANTSSCLRCGYDEGLKRGPLFLPHRTLLHRGQYLIGKVLGKPGGFGITYLALDTKLETKVAIKEYLPRDLAGRDAGHATISAHSEEDGEFFRYGLTQFLQEARTLAQFDHANIVRVRNFFEENGTGYLVMDYYDGITLADYLAQQPQGRLPEKTAVGILMPILDGLREVHAKSFLHRDIKPQNIYLTTANRPILLDFGAARQAMGERSRSLSVVLSEGYAPYEQYHRRGEQGPWTDIYACAAVLYHAVAGEAPPPATERVHNDELDIAALGVTASLREALRLGLAADHRNRPQQMTEFQALLLVHSGPNSQLTAEPKPINGNPFAPVKLVGLHPIAPTQSKSSPGLGVWLALAVVIFIALVAMNRREQMPNSPTVDAPVSRAGETRIKDSDIKPRILVVDETIFSKQLLGKVYGQYNSKYDCWNAVDIGESYCMRLYRTDKITSVAGDRYYLLALGKHVDEKGEPNGAHYMNGLVGAFIVENRNGQPEIVASKSNMAMGESGTPPDEWSFVKLGPADYWGWQSKTYSMHQGFGESSHIVLAPYAKQIRSFYIFATEDNTGALGDEKGTSLVAKLQIDSSQSNRKVFPLILTVTGRFEGKHIVPKTLSISFDEQKWEYVVPKLNWSFPY